MSFGRFGAMMATLALSVATSGCGGDRAPAETPAADDATTAAPATEALVVYADEPGEAALATVFTAFTRRTGIPVSIRQAPGAENLNDVIANRGAPPADILVAADLADIWQAADEGGLRQLPAESGAGAVPAALRDPDGLWVAVSVDPILIVQSAAASLPPDPDFAALAGTDYAGQLCVSVSGRAGNTALVGYLIDELGTRDAEIRVRRWLGNLALPPHSTAEALLEDIDGGICRAGIVTGSEVQAAGGATERRLLHEQGYFAGFGVGIARHARYPENAARLIAWLLDAEGQERFARATGTRPLAANDGPAERQLTTVGWQRDEVRRLAERARWP